MDSRRRCRPSLEALEDRYTPAGTVTGSFAHGTWTLVGDENANAITINPTATPGTFTVTGITTTQVAGVTDPTGVKHIVVKLFGGDDSVRVNDTTMAGNLAGNLSVFDGSGANYLYVKNFTVGQNLTVRNGTNVDSEDETYLRDTTVKGFVNINNGDGDTSTSIYRSSAGLSYIGKSLNITNGIGYDETYITDTNIGGNAIVRNGLPDAANEAGRTEFYNYYNTTARSVIGGNVLVVYQGAGAVDFDGIWDYDVRGNATFKHGGGTTETYFDGYKVNQPALIRGNLTIVDQGPSYIYVGIYDLKTGLIVGGNFTVHTGNQADTFKAYQLQVNGATLIQTGAGIDTITIDDSRFLGLRSLFSPFGFQLLTGAGNDVVDIETAQATSASTQFRGAVLVNLGSGDDKLTTGYAGDATRRVDLYNQAFLLGGADTDTFYRLHLDSIFNLPVHALFETVNL